MDHEAARQIEGMLARARRDLEAVADRLREALPPEQREEPIMKIARAMAELVYLSWDIYDEHPDLDPDRGAKLPPTERYAAYLKNVSSASSDE